MSSGDEGSNHEWMIGVLLSVTASTFSCLGVNTQKLVHTKVAKTKENTPFVEIPLWWLGMCLILLGSICDLLSYGFADISLLAPLGSLTMLTNLLVAPCIVKSEKLTRWDLICTSIIFTGVCISILFGSKSSTSYTLKELVDLYQQLPVMILGFIYLILGIIVYFIYNRYSKREHELLLSVEDPILNDISILQGDNVNDTVNSTSSSYHYNSKAKKLENNGLIMLDDDDDHNNIVDPLDKMIDESIDIYDDLYEQQIENNIDYKLLKFLLPTCAGMLGSCSALCGKSLAELFTEILDNHDMSILHKIPPYLILVSMIFFLITQVRVLNAGLRIASALYIVPIYQVMWSILNITMGMVYFEDYKHLTTIGIVMFPVGVIIIFAGMYLLSHPPDYDLNNKNIQSTSDESLIEVTEPLLNKLDDVQQTSHQRSSSRLSIKLNNSNKMNNPKHKRRQSVLISGGLRSSLVYDAISNTTNNNSSNNPNNNTIKVPRNLHNSRKSVIRLAMGQKSLLNFIPEDVNIIDETDTFDDYNDNEYQKKK